MPSVDPSEASSSDHLRKRSTAASSQDPDQRSEETNPSRQAEGGQAMLSSRARHAKALEDESDFQEMGMSHLTHLNGSDPDRKARSDLVLDQHRKDPPSGTVDGDAGGGGGFMDLGPKDQKAFALLVVLYLLQGVPVGLAFGTMPFLLKSRLSYSDIGFFMLCTYPYSLKLLWSPVVDSMFVNSVRLPIVGTTVSLGRRKSWIVPIQFIVGSMLWLLSNNVDQLLLAEIPNVRFITLIFFVLVLFTATQDIAVDGWALTLLSQENLSYASTAQTVGLNTGYFMSFTVFLAFNSVEFGNKYFRSQPLEQPILTLNGYLRFWSLAFFAVTAWLLLAKKEDEEPTDQPDMDVKKVYSILWKICQLKHIQTFIVIHLIAKIGFQANEAVTGLKLVEKGLGKEDLALAVLIDFPFQMVFGYLAARWSKGDNVFKPWIWAFVARLGFAVLSMLIVKGMPTEAGNPISPTYFFIIITSTVTSSFASTVQFVGITAFHTQIADPLIGGTYLTLLATFSNLGGTWPRYFVLKGVDLFTLSTCVRPTSSVNSTFEFGRECTSDLGKAACSAASGICEIQRDGYYWTSTICVLIGLTTLILYIIPACKRLQSLPSTAWRINIHSSSRDH
ncbi:hypothetical protein IE53DRAFT_386828 [Violaceomyces palustris]|uniref:Uncharacterized protein n=1 Tax=Violaceomyces palustris TaxID=1673888 RepID=A0ACD0NYH4_9BASI|nr:hypothetical protein IE53DRAFT_386828 [Violaceomyces palustris]